VGLPGLEVWKFVNLAVFLLGLLYFIKRPVSEAFKSRRESIQKELAEARREKEQALAKLAVVEERLRGLDSEVAGLREQANVQAQAERDRISREAESEMAALREQAKREIDSAGKAARQELRRFAARQSVKHAEEIVKREMRPADDARLIQVSVEQLGGTRN